MIDSTEEGSGKGMAKFWDLGKFERKRRAHHSKGRYSFHPYRYLTKYGEIISADIRTMNPIPLRLRN